MSFFPPEDKGTPPTRYGVSRTVSRGGDLPVTHWSGSVGRLIPPPGKLSPSGSCQVTTSLGGGGARAALSGGSDTFLKRSGDGEDLVSGSRTRFAIVG